MLDNPNTHQEGGQLKRTLGPVMLWGLGVGYVISGMYFGWNLGLPAGGTLGLAIATGFIIVMYLTFTFSYTELACAIPKAGGAFDYATRALGPRWGFLGGMAQNVEFIFAPPAIAIAIATYLSAWVPLPIEALAVSAFVVFTLLNISGVRNAAMFELFVTVIAVVELLIFAGATLPSFEMANLTHNSLPNGYAGIFAAIPFAIWFFLAIEGVANVAEETINPQRNVLIGFGSAILTLVVLCVLVFVSSVGVAGWEAIVYEPGSDVPSDRPLPLALAKIFDTQHWLYHLLITIGLFGLVASFHGIILAAGRATFEFGRKGYAPNVLGEVNTRFQTPANALLFNMVIGIIAVYTGKTADIITIAVFGALTLYIVSMIALLRLRKTEPNLERPFKAPLYPLFPIIALVIASVSLVVMCIYYWQLALVYAGLLGVAYVYYFVFVERKTEVKV